MHLFRGVFLFSFFSLSLFSYPLHAQSYFKIRKRSALEHFGERKIMKAKGLKSVSVDLGEENPLYIQIIDYFKKNAKAMAEEELGKLRRRLWGGMNHVGLSFSKGFGTFSVELKREVAPDLFSDDLYIATDTFDIYIDASTLLGELRDENIIEISDKQLALFAGVTFKRSYTYIHYEESYEKALAYNLDKLFFSFLHFRSKNYLDLERGDLLKKEDSLSFKVGGAGNVGITTGLAAHLAFLVEYETLSLVTLQGILENEENYDGEFLRLKSEKSSQLSTKLSAGVVADFMGLLQMSLLKYDFNYSLKESSSSSLSFHRRDRELLRGESEIGKEVLKILRHQRAREEVLAPYIVSSEERSEMDLSSAYHLLLFGGKKTADTTYYKINKDNTSHTFFSHSFRTAQYRENFLSKLFHLVLDSFVELTSVVKNSKEESRSVVMQYKSERNLVKTKEDLEVHEGEESVSLNFIRNYYAYRGGHRNTEELVDLLENFASLEPLILEDIKGGSLEESLRFYSKYSMTKDAIDYFNKGSVSHSYKVFDELCRQGRSSGFLGWFSSLFKVCERKLKKKYDLYHMEWNSNRVTAKIYKSCQRSFKHYRKRKWFISSRRKRMFLSACLQKLTQKSEAQKTHELPLWRLADFMDYYLKKAENQVFYGELFGKDNIHVYGHVSGIGKNDLSYRHFFSGGNFKGLDLISNFQRKNGLRTSLELK